MRGLNGLTDGSLDSPAVRAQAVEAVAKRDFLDQPSNPADSSEA